MHNINIRDLGYQKILKHTGLLHFLIHRMYKQYISFLPLPWLIRQTHCSVELLIDTTIPSSAMSPVPLPPSPETPSTPSASCSPASERYTMMDSIWSFFFFLFLRVAVPHSSSVDDDLVWGAMAAWFPTGALSSCSCSMPAGFSAARVTPHPGHSCTGFGELLASITRT